MDIRKTIALCFFIAFLEVLDQNFLRTTFNSLAKIANFQTHFICLLLSILVFLLFLMPVLPTLTREGAKYMLSRGLNVSVYGMGIDMPT